MGSACKWEIIYESTYVFFDCFSRYYEFLPKPFFDMKCMLELFNMD